VFGGYCCWRHLAYRIAWRDGVSTVVPLFVGGVFWHLFVVHCSGNIILIGNLDWWTFCAVVCPSDAWLVSGLTGGDCCDDADLIRGIPAFVAPSVVRECWLLQLCWWHDILTFAWRFDDIDTGVVHVVAGMTICCNSLFRCWTGVVFDSCCDYR
jgi:hypothetical protein